MLSDGNGAFRKPRCPAYHTVRWHDSVGRIDEEHIFEFATIDKLVSGAWVSNDYDFGRPRADLSVGTRDPRDTAHADGEIYQWPGDHAQPATGSDPWREGDMLSRIRIEALRQSGNRAAGRKPARSGSRQYLQADTSPAEAGQHQYLAYATSLTLEDVAEESGQGQHWQCELAFEVQTAKEIFRPLREVPKPAPTGRRPLPWSARRISSYGSMSTGVSRCSSTGTGSASATRIVRAGSGSRRPGRATSSAQAISPYRAGGHRRFPRGRSGLPDHHGPGAQSRDHGAVDAAEPACLVRVSQQELFGERHNTFLQDDTQGQIQTQIGSDHQATLLSLGYITRVPNAEGRKEKRGEGYELRTDGWGVLRAAKGMLVTTEARPGAEAHHKAWARPCSGSPAAAMRSKRWGCRAAPAGAGGRAARCGEGASSTERRDSRQWRTRGTQRPAPGQPGGDWRDHRGDDTPAQRPAYRHHQWRAPIDRHREESTRLLCGTRGAVRTATRHALVRG